jgi:hypothetical protein
MHEKGGGAEDDPPVQRKTCMKIKWNEVSGYENLAHFAFFAVKI